MPSKPLHSTALKSNESSHTLSCTDLDFNTEPELNDDISVDLTPDVEGREHEGRAEDVETHEHTNNLNTSTASVRER